MATKTKPGTVTAVLVLLILIAVYHLVMGTFSLFGAIAGSPEQAAEMLGEEAPPEWSIYLGALSLLAVGAASVVLAVLVGKSAPVARTAVIAVNVLAAVALLAMIATPAFGLDAVVSAVFLLVAAGLMFTSSAKQHFVSSSVRV